MGWVRTRPEGCGFYPLKHPPFSNVAARLSSFLGLTRWNWPMAPCCLPWWVNCSWYLPVFPLGDGVLAVVVPVIGVLGWSNYMYFPQDAVSHLWALLRLVTLFLPSYGPIAAPCLLLHFAKPASLTHVQSSCGCSSHSIGFFARPTRAANKRVTAVMRDCPWRRRRLWCTDIVLFNLIIFTSNSLFCLLIGRYYLYFFSPAAPGRILPSPGPCFILYLPRSACQSRSTGPCWPTSWQGLAAAPHMPSLIPTFMSHRFSVFAMVQQLLMAISNRPLHCIATTCQN